MTNGTQNAGLVNTTNNPNNYLFRTDSYGKNVGYTGSSISLITDGSLGITSDPTKSGMIISKDTTKYLFFFIN